MSKQITIDFLEDGSIKMDGQGFRGVECDRAMAEIEKSLGTQTSRKNKPEYLAQAVAAAQHARN